MEKIRISAVSYLNSKPFIYGLEHSELRNEIELQLDIPSVCADNLEENKVDVGLVPVAVLPELEEYHIISDYCIGADGEVTSVLLLSDVPLNEITMIRLDYQSRTSVLLAQILAKKLWKIKPQWKDAEANFEEEIHGTVAGVVIGDRTFSLKNKFNYVYDLAAEWKKLTSMPFVFACWVSNKKLPENFIHRLNEALSFGLENKEKVIQQYGSAHPASFDVKDYLENKISFVLDEKKKTALNLFLSYVNELLESGLMKIV